MNDQKLPNVTTSLVLGILSFVCCCFSNGALGVLMSLIALLILRKDGRMLRENPEAYSNAGSYRTARTIAIVGLVLSIALLGYVVFQIVQAGGWAEFQLQQQEQMQELFEKWGVDVPAE